MPQGRGRKKAKPKKPKTPNMIIVTITENREGRNLDVGVTGNLKLAEAPTLLKLAAKVAENKMGVE